MINTFRRSFFIFTKYIHTLGNIPSSSIYTSSVGDKKLVASLKLVFNTLPIILSSNIILYLFTKYNATELSMKNMINTTLPAIRDK